MPSTASLTLNDYDGQSGVVGWNTQEVTAANFVDVATGLGSMRDKIEEVTLGISIKSELSIISRFNGSNAQATSELAQRGNKWRIAYTDDTEFLDAPTNTIPNPGYRKSFDLELPTADLSLREANSDFVYSGGTGVSLAFETLATAVEAEVRSPYSGEVVVQFIKAVTRSGG